MKQYRTVGAPRKSLYTIQLCNVFILSICDHRKSPPSAPPTAEERRLWTDAICINKDDKEEKPHQIRQMTDIYCSASAVLMYLGEQDDDSLEAFELIHQAVKPQLTILDVLSNGSVITISRCRPSPWGLGDFESLLSPSMKMNVCRVPGSVLTRRRLTSGDNRRTRIPSTYYTKHV